MKPAENRRQSVVKSGLLASFGHALAGIVEATATQRNMTIHWAAAVGAVGAEAWLGLASPQR